MRRLVFLLFVLGGALLGGMTALDDGVGVVIVMAGIGSLIGLVVGGVLTRTGARGRARRRARSATSRVDIFGELDANYWRDRGSPPFMKPPDALPDRHMLDPDRQS